MKYWIDRFPRLLSHAYFALQSCSDEPIFSGYFPTGFVFSKPNYFYEETEDFKPFDLGSKVRDSPKRYVQDYRYKPMNYPNFVMERKPMSKKGSYNFHRFWNNNIAQNNYKSEPNDSMRNHLENPKLPEFEFVKGENVKKIEVVQLLSNETVAATDTEKFEDNSKKTDQEMKKIEKTEKTERRKSEKNEHGQSKRDDNQKPNDKHFSNKKKMKAVEAAINKDPVEVDDEGFTKVRYRNHNNVKKPKSDNNENVNWIVPGKEAKL